MTLSWERVGERFYRTLEGPELAWGIDDLQKWNVRVASGGGVITTWPNTHGPGGNDDVVVRRVDNGAGRSTGEFQTSTLTLWSSVGGILGTIPLEGVPVVDVLVTAEEHIIVVYASGLVRHYSDFGHSFAQLRLPGSVISVRIHPKGWVALTVKGFVAVSADDLYREIEGLSPQTVSETLPWTVIPENSSTGQSLQLLLVAESGSGATMVDISTGARRNVLQSKGKSAIKFEVSPDGLNIAVVFSDGSIEVWSTDFYTQRLVVSRTKASNGPSDSNNFSIPSPRWIGIDAVAIPLGLDEVEVHDIDTGAFASVLFAEAVALYSEVDALRAIGATNSYLLQRVPPKTVDALRVGSAAPAAMLVGCVDLLDQGSPRARTSLGLIGEHLTEAVNACIKASLSEVDSRLQKRLLRAAAFGKATLAPLYDASPYTDAVNTLRLVNTLRQSADMFMTATQLPPAPIIVSRLVRRRLWSVAVAVAQQVRTPVEPVYEAWACDYIQMSSDKSDDEILEALNVKIGALQIPHRRMARAALEEGRPALATKLVEHDPIASDRIALMLEMGEYGGALVQATESHNPHLVWYALLVLRQQLPLPEFLRLVGDNDTATLAYETLVAPTDPDEIPNFLYQVDRRVRSLELELQEVAAAPTSVKVFQARALATKCRPFKQLAPVAKATADWADILELQQQLMTEYDSPEIVGKSAADTVYALLRMGQTSRAAKVRSLLHIPERQFWWLQLSALAHRRDWNALYSLATSNGTSKRPPPIGFRPFYNACFTAGALVRAAEYAEIAVDVPLEERVKMLLQCDDRQRAIDVATRGRAPDLVARILAGEQP